MSTSNRCRCVFHPNHVPAFVAWAATQGWESVPPKGAYEVLRLVKGREVLPYYQRENTQHITIHDAGADLFVEWLNAAHRSAKLAKRAARRAAKAAGKVAP